MGPALARLLLSFTKLPLLLTPLTYMTAMDGGNAIGVVAVRRFGATLAPVGKAEIDYFGHKMLDHDLIRGSFSIQLLYFVFCRFRNSKPLVISLAGTFSGIGIRTW